nr:RHS repeat-associated core domain-containing protein [Mesorhizobium sp. NBSH29]
MRGEADELLLLAGDTKNSVVSEVGQGHHRRIAYTPYGYRSGYSSNGSDGRPQENPVGYNGEVHEDKTDWQLLGNGYRAYNPILSRFHTPDDRSPFDEGGVNSYAYCEGDPVNFTDPSGHNPIAWLGFVMVAGGIGALVGASRLEEGSGARTALQIGGGIAISLGAVMVVGGAIIGRGTSPGVVGRPVVHKKSSWLTAAQEREMYSENISLPNRSLPGGARAAQSERVAVPTTSVGDASARTQPPLRNAGGRASSSHRKSAPQRDAPLTLSSDQGAREATRSGSNDRTVKWVASQRKLANQTGAGPSVMRTGKIIRQN